MRIYSVHDNKAKAYLNPFHARTSGEAIRAFQTECKNPQSPFNQYPSDFTLYELGEFDEESASIATHKSPVHLSNASEFQQQL